MLTSISPAPPINTELLRRELEKQIQGEVRFDKVTRALYSTDASVYQIEPLGVVVAKSREDIVAAVKLCHQFRCPLIMRGGGTGQGGQAIGSGIILDTSKYLHRVLEVNVEERWARVEPGIVLDELNAQLRPHSLRFAPDVSTASRATVGGMMGNNSSGARSVIYGKTINHVLEQEVVLSDGSIVHFGPLSEKEVEAKACADTLEGACYRTVRRIAAECAEEVERRFPKVMRRVGGYNLDEFTAPGRPFNLAKLMVGSEGTLGVVLEARINLVPLPKAKSVVAVQFRELLEALAATPIILEHKPSAVEVMDRFILDHTKQNAALERVRQSFIEGDPGALLCIEFYGDRAEDLPPRMQAMEQDLRSRGLGYHFYHAVDLPAQARIWSLREAGLGLSMAMKDEAKSISFVEDTAVAPEKLRDYIERFLRIIHDHGTAAGIYAHASVGCLHVRPVVNLKTEEGLQKFESIATAVSDLVLEFGGALSGEHGDGYLRSPFMEKMFGPVLYQAFREIKRTFDPQGILNPGKIVDAPPLTANLRYGNGYKISNPQTFFDYSDYGGMGGAVEMCSGLGACRKKLDGTMCPSYMATLDEMHTTRGRANVLRLAMAGRLGEAGLGDDGVKQVLDLCLECRACKAECPVGVDMARFKSEFLADYWTRHGTPLRSRLLGNVHSFAKWGSLMPPLANFLMRAARPFMAIASERTLPKLVGRPSKAAAGFQARTLLFHDTFTKYYDPEIATAALAVLHAAGVETGIAPNTCCGRPMISQGLLPGARKLAEENTKLLYPLASEGKKFLFCEPSCLSAMRDDVPSLLRGEAQRHAETVGQACFLFEEFLEEHAATLALKPGPKRVLLHGHCHQKSMGLLATAKSLLSRIPGAAVVDLDAGCCGMAGSFGYAAEHLEVSRAIGERKLLPAARAMKPDEVLVAAGTSCRHQVSDFTGVRAVHPAVLLASLLAVKA